MKLLDLQIENARLRMELLQAQSVILNGQFREQGNILASLMQQREGSGDGEAQELGLREPAAPGDAGPATRDEGSGIPIQ